MRTWLEHQVLPAFQERILMVDIAVARRCAHLHIPDPRAERDALIAALRSRLTPFFFSAPEAIPAAPYPDSEEAWLAFLERRSAPESNRRSASADLREELQAWTRYCLEKGAYSQADTLNHLSEILSGIPLASSMATDLVALTLGEGLQLDSFFGPVREA